MVRGGSVGLNRPELMSNSTAGLVPCVVLWFEQVRKSSSLFLMELSGLRKFGRVEPPRTHEKLSYDPCLEAAGLVLCVVLCFEKVRKS